MHHLITRKASLIYTLSILLLLSPVVSCSSAKEAEMPEIIENNGRYALLVDGEPFFVLGGQSANSSTWPNMLPGVWNTIESMHANTLEIPIYWEQFEPEPGKYDTSIVQMLLDQARERDVRLVLLWFATWKNGSNHYMPRWMKTDSKKYPNIIGKDGQPVDSPSPHANEAMEADAKAFAEFMAYLKEADPQHTVIMVQVQNEPGSWGSVRDYSPAAQLLFEQSVPEALLQAEVLKQLNVPAGTKGTWEEVFAENADEYFHAWSVARYIEYVAAAGKAVNPMPMYV
ncbi:MAG: beta-galactosidase, partial [Bacteroidales bacterium]